MSKPGGKKGRDETFPGFHSSSLSHKESEQPACLSFPQLHYGRGSPFSEKGWGGCVPKSKHNSPCPAQDVSVRLSPSTGRRRILISLSCKII